MITAKIHTVNNTCCLKQACCMGMACICEFIKDERLSLG
jgi:hypothetical protein